MIIDKRCDDDPNEGEWQAQERALRQERLGAASDEGTPRERHYRLLARVLAEQPAENLLPDFAASMARQVAALDAAEEARERQFERRLIVAMWSMLALAVIGVAIVYGNEIVTALRPGQTSSPASPQWLCVLLGCIGVSWLAQRLRPNNSR